MTERSERPLAAHVQAAVVGSLQAKTATPTGFTRPMAHHVQQAIARPNPARSPLQAALDGRLKPRHMVADVQPAGRKVAPHVQRAIGTLQAAPDPTLPTVLPIQRSAKPKKVAHTTRKGKIKESTLEYLKNLPKGTKPADVIGIWEAHHSMLDEFAAPDGDALPANTAGSQPQRVDLAALQDEYYVLGTMLNTAVADCGPGQSRGPHYNEEGKLPTYGSIEADGAAYEEFSFFKGGGRLVVDSTSGRAYISLHYSTFYRIS